MKKNILFIAAICLSVFTFGQSKENVTAKIWETDNFCVLPEKVNVPKGVAYSNTMIYRISCDTLNSQNLTGVWITFEGKNVSKLSMTSQYKNIELIKKDNKGILFPIAYMERPQPAWEDGPPEYNSNESTFEVCINHLNPNEKYDLFILFESAEVGDKLIIKDFLEAEIK